MNKPIRRGRGLLATALLVAGGAVAFLPTVAGASTPKPQINVVTDHTGTHTVGLGTPQTASGAKLSPSYIANNAANGDEAVSVTAGGKTHVYLIAGANEANEYNIATSITSGTHLPVYGSLVKGVAYLVAGTHTSGSADIVGNPGGTVSAGGSTSVQAVTNPINPQSLTFDNSGNLLIGEAQPTTTASKTAIQMVAKAACASACAYGYGSGGHPALVAGGLYTVAGSGFAGVSTTPAISFTSQVQGLGLAVDSTGNIVSSANGLVLFLNEQAGSVTRYGVNNMPHHVATVIAGTTVGTATCGGGAVTVTSTGHSSPNLQWARPTLDASGNVFINDNRGSGTHGCSWVLPAASGTFHGTAVIVGHLYSLTGAAGTTAASTNGAAASAGIPNAQAIVPDKAGNVVIAQGGTSVKLWVVAESTTVWYGQSMTKGHIYRVCGGGTTLTTPTTCTKFKLEGSPRVTTLPNLGVTSLAQGAAGHLLLTNGSSLTTGAAFTVSTAPTGPPSAVVTSVSPTNGSTNGHTPVTIHGRNLAGTTTVSFGGTTATTVSNVATTEVTAKTAAHAAGLVTVTVHASLGTGTKLTAFTYVSPASTHITLSVSPSGTVYTGTTVTITAHVTPNTVAGHVKFFDGSTTLGTVAVASGVAHYSTTSLIAGTHHLHATFTPTTSTAFQSSTSSTTTLKVTTHPTTGGNVIQQFGQTVKAGFLTLNCLHPEVTNTPAFQTCPIINFTQVTLNGTTQTRTKPMNPLYVLTARGTPTSGWALSVSMVPTAHTLQTNTTCWGLADFCDSSIGTHASDPNLHGQIAAKHLTLGTGYTCLPQTTNTNPQPPAETNGTFGRSGSATVNGQYAGTMALCQAAHGNSGGIFKVSGANYTLTVPPTVYHGLYYGTVEYTLVSI